MSETTEAVIISGRRRGEIVTLSEDLIPERLLNNSATPSDDDDLIWATLNSALDRLFTSIDRVLFELKETTTALRGE